MDKFTRITARVMPLPLKDVDTDQIIPAQYMTSISRDGYGENVFRRLRDNEPNFPMNLAKFQGARILAAESNFGCGSSREHAVWALMGAGFAVVIAKSFADIFYNNSAKNGLLLVSPAAEIVDRVLRESANGDYPVTVDLEHQTLELPNGTRSVFDYDPFRKHCLLNGLDDIDYINSHKETIGAYRKSREAYRLFATTTANR